MGRGFNAHGNLLIFSLPHPWYMLASLGCTENELEWVVICSICSGISRPSHGRNSHFSAASENAVHRPYSCLREFQSAKSWTANCHVAWKGTNTYVLIIRLVLLSYIMLFLIHSYYSTCHMTWWYAVSYWQMRWTESIQRNIFYHTTNFNYSVLYEITVTWIVIGFPIIVIGAKILLCLPPISCRLSSIRSGQDKGSIFACTTIRKCVEPIINSRQ